MAGRLAAKLGIDSVAFEIALKSEVRAFVLTCTAASLSAPGVTSGFSESERRHLNGEPARL